MQSPWGTFICSNSNQGDLFCQYYAALIASFPEGPCKHFDFWEKYDDEHADTKLEKINEKNWHDKEFAIHMQEETIYNLYGLIWELLDSLDLIGTLVKLGPHIPGRTRNTYRLAAVELLSIYLKVFGNEYDKDCDWTNVYHKDDLLPPKGIEEHLIHREFELRAKETLSI